MLACSLALAALRGHVGGGGGMAAKSSTGIPLGVTSPHDVQPLPDKPRFGKPVSEADLAAWNIDIRTPDGQGLPAGRGSVAQGRQVYAEKCVACHGADAKGGAVYGTMVGGIGSFKGSPRVLTPGQHVPVRADPVRLHPPLDADGPPADADATTRSTRCRRTSST